MYNNLTPELTNLELEFSECMVIDPIQFSHHLKCKVCHDTDVVHSTASCRLEGGGVEMC